jgi:hypothetical protein
MQSDIRELTERVQALERQNKNLKRYGIAAAALLGVVGLSSMASSMCKTVWAERFVLQDSQGRERGVITAYETGGTPTLSLLDHKGQKALSFGVADSGRAYVEIPGAEGMVRSQFAVSPEGLATIEKGKDVAAR